MSEATSTSQAEYSAALSPLLPRHVFQPRPQRLVFGAIHAVIVTACTWGIMVVATWPLQLLLGVLLGHSLAIISFLGHEILHGSVVKGRTLVRLLGGLCFSFWGLLPWVWVRWHNQIHHKHTNDPFVDPDCWGKELTYRVSRVARFLEWFSPGSGRLTSALYLPAFFSVKVLVMIAVFPGFIKSRWERIQALGYFLAVNTLWCGLGFGALGGRGILVLYVVPLMAANTVIMSYIATNHSLNRLTETANDCLANSLTVRSPRFLERLHLNFNYHVEHHVFPSVSPHHAPLIREHVRRGWGERYQELSHIQALVQLYHTPRFYMSTHSLINPRTRKQAPTIT